MKPKIIRNAIELDSIIYDKIKFTLYRHIILYLVKKSKHVFSNIRIINLFKNRTTHILYKNNIIVAKIKGIYFINILYRQ